MMKLNCTVMEFYFIYRFSSFVLVRTTVYAQMPVICLFFFLMLQGYTESVHIRASSGVRSKMKRHQVSGKPQSDVRRQIKQPQEKRDFKIRMVKEIWCMDGRCTAGEVIG